MSETKQIDSQREFKELIQWLDEPDARLRGGILMKMFVKNNTDVKFWNNLCPFIEQGIAKAIAESEVTSKKLHKIRTTNMTGDKIMPSPKKFLQEGI